MNSSSGLPRWTWPDWRKAPAGLRVRHNRSGRYGTYLRPAKIRHDGAVVRWDDSGFGVRESKVISPARDLTPVRIPAWDLIGFDSSADSVTDELQGPIGEGTVMVRLAGARARYEAVMYNDTTRGERVKLARLDTRDGLREVSRYVAPDAQLELIQG